ncbi:DUF4129 domain-containing protein [Halococcus agarilyticus]|uniref:DUF4129 domain-containing protein n=1 Tax=Halococcus agarilyticus TaxID=1232219 RepID=UPI000677D7DD|nr:DUF4129 domain-containing protein [Halococcus agarilyticus]
MADRSPLTDRRHRNAALAALAVLAVVLVAAAVAPVFSSRTGGDGSPQIERSNGNSTGGVPGSNGQLPTTAIVVGFLALGGIVVVIQFADDPWNALKRVVGLGAVTVLLLLLAERFTDLRPPSRGTNRSVGQPTVQATTTPVGNTGFEGGGGTAFSWPVETIVLGAAAAAVAGAVALFLWRSDAVRSRLGVAADDTDESDLGSVARVAGDAADRVESASTSRAADNAIYRAWTELVDLLDAPGPQSGTPRQFESAAIERGMDPEDVHVLTEAFEAVRYGDASTSPPRRERVTAALRRLQRAHGETPSDGAGGSLTATSAETERSDDTGETR